MTQETEIKEVQSSIPEHILTTYADLWTQRPHCAKSLETILSKHFNVPIQIVQLSPEGDEIALDSGAMDVQNKVRLRVGPLTKHQFNMLSPGGPRALLLAELTRVSNSCKVIHPNN